MFLDDKLLLMCRHADIKDETDIQSLYRDLCNACELYYKGNIAPTMSNKEIKSVLDKTFNIWDSFVRMAVKEEGIVGIMGKLCQELSFKKVFLGTKGVKAVYDNL